MAKGISFTWPFGPDPRARSVKRSSSISSGCRRLSPSRAELLAEYRSELPGKEEAALEQPRPGEAAAVPEKAGGLGVQGREERREGRA